MHIIAFLYKFLIKNYPLFHGCAACPHPHIDWRSIKKGGVNPNFPVDFVFTWVQGADPAFIDKRAPYLPEKAERIQEYQGDSLYRDSEELRYALRSLELYAPWFRRVFILTDAQRPAWLREDEPKARIVDHTECIPAEYLPTFNSHVIEAYLHRIPDLSEHFVYCNDDFFLLAPCEKTDFFTLNGMPYAFIDWRKSRRRGYALHSPHAASFANARSYLEDHGIVPAPDFITAHVPYPLTKSDMARAHEFFAEAIAAFGRNKFRTLNDMALVCHAVPLLSYALKQTVPRDVPYYYINAKRFDRLTYYQAMLAEKHKGTLPPFLCLNDVGEVPQSHSWRREMKEFLQKLFPKPSMFETGFGTPPE